MNQKKLAKLIFKLCSMLEETPFEDPLKVFLLDSLTIYMQVDGRVIK